MKRLFYAHARSLDGEDLDAAVERLDAAARVPLTEVEIVTGRDDFKARAASAGGWNGWARSIGGLTIAGRPRFDVIVIDSPTVGRATSTIVEGCLATGRDVVLWPVT